LIDFLNLTSEERRLSHEKLTSWSFVLEVLLSSQHLEELQIRRAAEIRNDEGR